ncbi:hypothetical protein LWI28_018697 [Acer negundo]|uniref:Uncharacterized protein n=1 Tax=Acer negundo TaxID=4023 RepID=A0AAD5NK10_ACENE|nr:hypothetical protein LWI28_018697 [Acer negundo]
MRTYKRLRTNETMVDENQDREDNQILTENVNVVENVTENVTEADNIVVVRYVPQNDEYIQQTEIVVQIEHASDNEDLDQYLLIGLLEIWPTRMEVKEDYWKGIDDDMSEGPLFVPLKDFVGKEDGTEPSSKQLHKKKRKWYHTPNQQIKRRQNLFDASPCMRTTRHVRDRPDLEPPPLDETHSPLYHQSLGGTKTGVPSSGVNHMTLSSTRLR